MAFKGDKSAPLLPASLQGRLRAWLCKVLGFLVLVGCAAAAVSLLTWSVADPSLTRATSGATRNLLGPVGAVVSDLVMQMLGLAGVFCLLPPMVWALQLVTGERIERVRGKLVFAPLAVFCLAAALSSVPSAPTWPLHHGFGGVLGDLGLSLLSSLLFVVNPERAAAAAGLFYLAAGMLVLMTSLGLSQHDFKLMLAKGSGLRFSPQVRLKKLAAWGRQMKPAAPAKESQPRREPTLELPKWARAREARRPSSVELEPTNRALSGERDTGPAALDIVPSSLLDPAFDASTELGSRAIAMRFAPATGAAVRAANPVAVPDETHVATAPPVVDSTAGYRAPALNLLARAPAASAASEPGQSALHAQAQALQTILGDFGIRGEVKGISPGPVITVFEFEPARGIKASRVISLADDVARSIGAVSVRMAVVAGRNAIGIELPNPRRQTVALRELIEADAFTSTDARLPLALGKRTDGVPVFADLARMPHLLVAGTTGSGKSVGLNAMVLSLLYKLSPAQCRFLMIDPKMLELSVYNGIEHLIAPVVTDPHKAVAALGWVVREMEERYRRMTERGVRNIDAFNGRVRSGDDDDLAPMPYIVVVVDELADLMLVAGKEIEQALQRLAQMARAAGIHLIMATQRPSVDVITGTIKANFPTRISFKVASKFDSRTILNQQGAEQLLGHGDMLFSAGTGTVLRVHGACVSDEEIERVAASLRAKGEPRYVGSLAEELDAPGPIEHRPRGSMDDLYQHALAVVGRERKASASYLQRRLSIGYNRAAELIERMEQEGAIGPPAYNGRREILFGEGDDARRPW